jgi:hypothetical protein
MVAKGSWNSPIYISDDEDEHDVAGQLIYPEHDSTPPSTSPHHPQNQLSAVPQPMYAPSKLISLISGPLFNLQLDFSEPGT